MTILEQLNQMDKREAIALLQGSYRDFCAAVETILAQTERRAIDPAATDPVERWIGAKAEALRRDGYCRLEQVIADRSLLAEATSYARGLKPRADLLGVSTEFRPDPGVNGLFWPRHSSGFNTRASFDAARTHPVFQLILAQIGIADRVVETAIGVDGVTIKRRLLIVDHLQPTDEVEFQWWHFDRLCQQYKAMIFLEDVDDGAGPMRLLPGSHHFEGKRRIYDFCNYAEPMHGADPGYAVVKDRQADIVKATGQAGDLFLFDTKAFHAHGRPTQRERNTATLYYDLPTTPLNLFFAHFKPDDPVGNY